MIFHDIIYLSVTKTLRQMTVSFDQHMSLFDPTVDKEMTSSGLGFDRYELPFYPELCTIRDDMDGAQYDCTLLGITVPCIPNYTEADLDQMGDQLQIMHLFTFFTTLAIGLICLRGTFDKCGNFTIRHGMAINVGFYAIVTGTFALFRWYFGVSRPLAVTGVLHNLFEWVIIIHLTEIRNEADKLSGHKATLQRRLLIVFCVQILLISLGIIIPDLTLGFAIIQIFGIVLDFGYPILFIHKYITSEDKDEKTFYYIPALAHFIHLFLTILPLAVTIFLSLSPSWFTLVILETLIHVTVPITHLLYAIWAWWVFDKKAFSTYLDDRDKKNHTKFLLEEGYTIPIRRVRIVLGSCFVIAMIFFVSAPKVLGPCESEFEKDCQFREEYTVISDANVQPGFQLAFKEWISAKQLVEKAKETPGNVEYEVHRAYGNHSRYQLVSKWDSLGAYDDWKEATFPLFQSADFKRMLVSGKFKNSGPYVSQPPSCALGSSSAESFQVKSNCAAVWSLIETEHSCFWIPNCDYASLWRNDDHHMDGFPKMVNLEMNDGRILKANRFISNDIAKITYNVLDSDPLMGFSGTLSMTESDQTGGVCDIHYRFQVSEKGQVPVAYVLDAFRKQIPYLEQHLGGKLKKSKRRKSGILLPAF